MSLRIKAAQTRKIASLDSTLDCREAGTIMLEPAKTILELIQAGTDYLAQHGCDYLGRTISEKPRDSSKQDSFGYIMKTGAYCGRSRK